MIRLTGGGWDNNDNPCAVGGTPSKAPVLLPPIPPPESDWKAFDKSICSTLAVETWTSAFPFITA
jgi:hypothetical protein